VIEHQAHAATGAQILVHDDPDIEAHREVRRQETNQIGLAARQTELTDADAEVRADGISRAKPMIA
jgi:hypothetical protein